MKHRCYIDDYNIYEEEITIKNLSSRRRELSKERRRVPLIYVPYGILPFKNTALCQNPQFVTGRKDSLCGNRGTEEAPVWWIVKKESTYATRDVMACLISSTTGAFPWLSVWNIAGVSADATVNAGDLFCKGETRGVWVGLEKVADPELYERV